jgi:hypothetical protein
MLINKRQDHWRDCASCYQELFVYVKSMRQHTFMARMDMRRSRRQGVPYQAVERLSKQTPIYSSGAIVV